MSPSAIPALIANYLQRSQNARLSQALNVFPVATLNATIGHTYLSCASNNAMESCLIVFEGPDGVGKSTLVEFLRRFLEAQSIAHEIVSFPGDRPGTLGELVYDLHHASQKYGIGSISPAGLQALHIAAHLDAITQIIIPALRSGSWVVLDRFWWSTWVYGRAAGIDPRILDALIEAERRLWGQFSPSVVFLIQRTEPFGGGPPTDDFTTLSNLYRQLSSSEAAQHEVVTIKDADAQAASSIVAQWVARRRE
jgi:thymidylate kinase